jgi:TfoX/Sxy family transcriptional regulator of competence genes
MFAHPAYAAGPESIWPQSFTKLSLKKQRQSKPQTTMQPLPLSYSTVSVVPDAEEIQYLPSRYQPNEIDIVCERGQTFAERPGNKKFLEAIRSNVQRYGEARKRADKILIVDYITFSLQQDGARFIKLDKKSNRYYELSGCQARAKTGGALRHRKPQTTMQPLPLSYSTVSVVPDAEEIQYLPSRYQPNEIDIVCERGPSFTEHPGNKKFSEAIRSNLQRYGEARKRADRSIIVDYVTFSVQQDGARFIKWDKKSNRFYELSGCQARAKTGAALRHLLYVTALVVRASSSGGLNVYP